MSSSAVLVRPPGHDAQRRMSTLTPREREVLTLVAQGRSNAAIARQLFLTAKTVESHMASILGKICLLQGPDDHRRVLAVLAWLEVTAGAGSRPGPHSAG